MKSLQDVIDNYEFGAFDGRDLQRLATYFTVEQLQSKGFTRKDESKEWIPDTWSESSVLENLQSDLAFAFEKALDKRGISAGCMWHVIRMWNHILEADIPETYAQYGLPYLKATALHFGFDNPIGDDNGDEWKYSAEGYESDD